MSGDLDRRAAAVRSRAAVRAWEYRQRHHAKGVWGRLRRALAVSEAAFALSDALAQELEGEGFAPEPVGGELEPPKRIFFVPAARLTSVEGARAVPLRLGPELLAARALALVPFA